MNNKLILGLCAALAVVIGGAIGALAFHETKTVNVTHVKHVRVEVPDPLAEVKGELAEAENIYQQANGEAELHLGFAREEATSGTPEAFGEEIGQAEAFTEVLNWTNADEGRLLRAHPELETETEGEGGA